MPAPDSEKCAYVKYAQKMCALVANCTKDDWRYMIKIVIYVRTLKCRKCNIVINVRHKDKIILGGKL